MTWAVSTRVCLESCKGLVEIFTMDQRKEQRVCITFCADLGKRDTETLWMIQRGFGDQSLSRTQVYQCHTRFKTGRTSVDDEEHTGRPQEVQLQKLLHEFKSSSVRIFVGQFATFLRRWKFVMGHASGFSRKNCASTLPQPNLCPIP